MPPPIEKYFFGQISLEQLILLLDNAPDDPGALQQAVHNFRSSKRARIDVASIPRQPVPQPPPPPFSPPTSPAAPSAPPPPTPLSPAAPVPPPFPVSSASTYVTPDVPSTTSDPTPRSRTPRREPDSVLPTLEPGDRPPPWNPAPGIEPVGAPGTTPLRPPAPGLSSSAHSPRDIRDFNPPDPDLQKGKGKGKAPERGRGRGNQGHSRGPGNGKGKHKGKIIGKDQDKGASPAASRSSTSSPSHICQASPRQRSQITPLWVSHFLSSYITARLAIVVGPAISSFLHFHYFLTPNGPACHCGRSRLLVPFPIHSYPVTSLRSNPPPLPPHNFLHYLKGPACHCGRSRLIPSPYPILHKFIPPHRSSQISTIPSPILTNPHNLSPIFTTPLIHLLARLVIVAGPAFYIISTRFTYT